MALSKNVYKALEDIVGEENISDDPAILDSYAFQWLAELNYENRFTHRPEAVLLPKTTEEVQAIVKACNRYKLKVKAHGSGWGAWGGAAREGIIQLDMRRMDRIEIDEKNMIAVVEAGVIAVQLQAEAMKRGLNCHMIGAGSSCAVVAYQFCLGGMGPDSLYQGWAQENLLAVEMVTPAGDILRTGSLSDGVGWFCSEGPGPSLRGLVRGNYGALGGCGVTTRCAVKLVAWPAPAPTTEGTIPAYRWHLPDNIRTYTIDFPSWDAFADAVYRIQDAEIGYISHRQFPQFGTKLQGAMLRIITDPTKTTDDLEALLKKPEVQKFGNEMLHGWQFILAGMTPRDIEWQDKVLDKILSDIGGCKVKSMSEPLMEEYCALYMLRLPTKNINFVYDGTFSDAGLLNGVPDFFKDTIYPDVIEAQKREIAKGTVVDTGGDAGMGGIGAPGGGGWCALEPFYFYDPADRESVKGAIELLNAGDGITIPRLGSGSYFSTCMLGVNVIQGKTHLPPIQPFKWQQKVKEMLDPNDIGDGMFLSVKE